MLTEEEIKRIINQTNIETPHKLELIQQLIYDKKGVEVKINTPNNHIDHLLMMQAFNISYIYYKDKFRENNNE